MPAEAREFLGVEQGEYVIFKEEGGKLVVARAILKEVE
jgi:bifunctional DNA-binding transcriptional regulator/antitoxin component of YhaV-PrlF toxin-antitoxin module